jgi:hypothetical protein
MTQQHCFPQQAQSGEVAAGSPLDCAQIIGHKRDPAKHGARGFPRGTPPPICPGISQTRDISVTPIL